MTAPFLRSTPNIATRGPPRGHSLSHYRCPIGNASTLYYVYCGDGTHEKENFRREKLIGGIYLEVVLLVLGVRLQMYCVYRASLDLCVTFCVMFCPTPWKAFLIFVPLWLQIGHKCQKRP